MTTTPLNLPKGLLSHESKSNKPNSDANGYSSCPLFTNPSGPPPSVVALALAAAAAATLITTTSGIATRKHGESYAGTAQLPTWTL